MVDVGATLRVVSAPGIKDTSAIIVDGTFDLSTATGSEGPVTETIGGLSGNGMVNLGSNFLGCTNQAAAYTNFGGNFIGSGGFRQFISGVQVFSGTATTATIAMTVDDGELHIWGDQPSASVDAIAGRLVLADDATIGALTLSGDSVLSFDESISAMNLHGTASSLVMSGNSTFQVVPLGAPPTQYSYLTTGSADISGANITIDTSGYSPAPDAVMTIIENTGSSAITGTFSGFSEGATVTASNDAMIIFQISYVGGSGNDVTLLRLSPGPAITAITAGTITDNGATIMWTTDDASDSQVQYGLSAAYGIETTLDASQVTTHSQPISGLSGGTLYHFRVLSRNAGGFLTTSADNTFVTTAISGSPVISAISSGTPTETGATVTWTTDIDSDTQIIYGLTTSYGSETPLGNTLPMVTAHSQNLAGLKAGKVYHYRVLSRSAGGQLATSADNTFTTAADVTAPVMADISCTISGVATNGKLVTIGGTDAVPASNGSYSITILVPDGTTQVTMVITYDDDTTATRTITLDSAPAGVI